MQEAAGDEEDPWHPPEGFVEVQRKALGFMALCGPTYVKPGTHQALPVIGLRVRRKHLNMRGTAHGGMLVTLADSALAHALNHHRGVPFSLVTVSLTTDFVEPARLDDWVEAHVDIQRAGTRMAFANCYLHVGERRVLRASGVFAIVQRAQTTTDDTFDD